MGLSTTVLFSQSLPRTPSVRGVAAGSCPSRPVPSCSSAPGGRRAPCRAHRLTPADDELYQRTRVTVLEPESPNTMFIEGYTSRGFTISGDLVVGPCAILPRAILQWNPNACATFNFLTSEKRVAAAGLIPPRGTYVGM
ncbi:NADH dehydrogenase [ubiquinone] 1 alpha subcomplex assembly factor 3 isoform 4-T4 [Alca torda]